MKIKLKQPFELRLNVQEVELRITDIFKNANGIQASVVLDIKASERFSTVPVPVLDEQGTPTGETEMQDVLVPLSASYNLERPDVQEVPYELIAGLIQSLSTPQILPFINQKIEEMGFNEKFTGSLEGLKLEIESVTM